MSLTRVLFVDDDPFLLQAQRRVLWGTSDWEADFVNSGATGLAQLATKPFDAVVSDVRMPVMDGAQFLTEVQNRYPQTLRVILSGQNEQEGSFHGLGPAQRYLSKPCDPDELKNVINQSVALFRSLPLNAFDRLIVGHSHLESLSDQAHEVLRCAQLPDTQKTDVAKLVAAHGDLATLFIRVANASGRTAGESIEDAIHRLPWEVLRPLLLCAAAFSHVCKDPRDPRMARSIERSARIGSLAATFAKKQNADPESTAYAMTAGLLIDLGAICLSQCFPTEHAIFDSKSPPCVHAESNAAQIETYGLTSGQMTACLLQRWGVPYGIIDAVIPRRFRVGDILDENSGLSSIPVRAVAKAVSYEFGLTVT